MVETKNSRESLQITKNERFNSVLLAKDKSLANPSFRIYYGGATGTVPFLWESQPGTPKNNNTSNTLPPLTPPPSYTSTHNKKKFVKRCSSSTPKLNSLLHCIIPKAINKQMTNLLSSSPSVSSSSEHSSFSLESGDDTSSPKSTISYRGNGRFSGCCYSLW